MRCPDSSGSFSVASSRAGSAWTGAVTAAETKRVTKKLGVGKHKVKATYSGSWKARRSVSKVAVVQVG